MAEETQKPAAAAEAQPAPEVVVEAHGPPAEKPVIEKDAPGAPVEEAEKVAAAEEVVEAEKPKAVEETERKIGESASFKEETNVVGELPDPQKKALDELKHLIQEALNKHEFTAPPTPPPAKVEEKKEEKAEETVEVGKKAAVEETKAEEKAEASTEAAVDEKPPKVESETVEVAAEAEVAAKSETVVEPVKEKVEEKVEAPIETPEAAAVVVETVEKVAVIDEDGAKTVEAIEETVVAVTTSQPEESTAAVAPAEPKEESAPPAPPPPPPEEVFIYGIPLLADERSDVILLKFLRARDFKVKEAFAMIKNTVRWRKEFGIDALVEEDLGSQWDKVVFTHGVDKEGHPVCYNVFGEFENEELYQNTFGDEEKRSKFLKWRIQFLEKSIRKLDFSPDGINTIVQVNDLRNSPGLAKWELRTVTKQAVHLLQDNYPEFVARQVFVNVPWWYLAVNRMISPFLTQRTKSKFVFAGPSKTAEALFKYIAPEHVPLKYGGLSREGEHEFTTSDSVTEVIIKPASKQAIELPVSETCHLVWEARVVGWDVNYGAEFVPGAEDGYTVIVQKSRKIGATDEPVIVNRFKIGEPGKVVLNIDNPSSKKKKLLYRSKTVAISD